MFWEILLQLCAERKTTPNTVCAELGLSTAIATKWKKGAIPRDTTLKMIADYFGTTIEYLKGETDEKEKPTVKDDELSENMKQLIEFAKSVPDEKIELVLKVMKSIVEAD